MAEAAGERAADLGGDADGAAVLLGDVDGLDLLAVAEAEQPLAGGVGAGLLGGDRRAADDEALVLLKDIRDALNVLAEKRGEVA